MKTMIAASIALFAVGYAAMYFLGVFEGLNFHEGIAAVIGIILTTGVAIALMSLIFYSARARHDEAAHNLWKRSKSGRTRF